MISMSACKDTLGHFEKTVRVSLECFGHNVKENKAHNALFCICSKSSYFVFDP